MLSITNPEDVTRLLLALQDGQEGASEQLAPLVYSELHSIAQRFMRNERDGHTLQPTALVHEAYMRLVDQRQRSWQNRSHFYAIAAQAMRRILVDHARRQRAGKREGGERITLDEAVAATDEQTIDIIALNDALEALQKLDERQARVVELRFFGGLDIDETAAMLGTSASTVKRDWAFARAFLQRTIESSR